VFSSTTPSCCRTLRTPLRGWGPTGWEDMCGVGALGKRHLASDV
jgi:hypothetical protein